MKNIRSVLTRARAKREMPSPAEARRLREAVGLTQAEVADLIGTTRAAVTRYEGGRRRPRGTTAERYARLLRRLAREGV